MSETEFLFPVEQQLTTEFLKANFWKCNFTSVEKSLQYWILLPNTVKVKNTASIDHDYLGLTVIGQYSTIENSPYLEVQVLYEHINYEMNASDWLVKKLLIMGEKVLKIRELKGVSTGNYLDVLTSKQWPDGENIISRFTVLKDSDSRRSGANILCVKSSCIESDYKNLANLIFQIVANWDLIHKSDWQMAEALFPFEYDFAEKVTFFVPESWEIKFEENNSKTFSRFVFIHDVHGVNKGIISAQFYALASNYTPEIVLEKSLKRLNSFNIELSQLMSEDSTNPSIIEIFNSTGIIIYDEEHHSAFLNLILFKTKGGWYYFEQIGPKPNLENDYWEINKRAMELIIDSFNNMAFLKVQLPKKINNNTNIIDPKINKWLPSDWKNDLF